MVLCIALWSNVLLKEKVPGTSKFGWYLALKLYPISLNN